MALDILSILAMSADPERLFSGTKITISNRRLKLSIATIQALECLKSWLGMVEAVEDESEDEDKDILQGRKDTTTAGGFIDIDDTVDLYRL
jgi:hypothetical protein